MQSRHERARTCPEVRGLRLSPVFGPVGKRGSRQRGGGRIGPSSVALHREMSAWGRRCKAYQGRHVVWHRHSCLCPMCGMHPPWSQARVPVPPRRRLEHRRLMAMGKPLRTRGQMTSRGGGQRTSTPALPARRTRPITVSYRPYRPEEKRVPDTVLPLTPFSRPSTMVSSVLC